MPFHRHRSSAAAALLLVIAALSPARGAETEKSPFDWTAPAAPPEFRELVTDEDYKARSEAVLRTFGDYEALAKSRTPAVGMRCFGIFPNTQAERAGMKVGDIATRLDQQVLWSSTIPRTEERQTLEYYSAAADRVLTTEIEPRAIGINPTPHWRPELLYLHGTTRSPKWDRDVLVGIVARERDPDLAETAWHRAVAAGYEPDEQSAMAGATIALAQNRPDAAADFAWPALQSERETRGGTFVHPILLYRVAAAAGKLREAARLIRDHRAMFGDAAPEALLLLAERQESADEYAAGTPPPSRRAESMYRDDLIPRSRGLNFYSIEDYLPAVRRGEPPVLESTTAHYRIFAFGCSEPTRDVDFRVRFTVKPYNQTNDRYSKQIMVRLEATDPGEQGDVPWSTQDLLEVGVNEHAAVQLSHSNLPTEVDFAHSGIAADGEQPIEIRCVRVGARAEAFLNGQRVLDVPVDPNIRQVSCVIQVVGSVAKLLSVEADELIERP